MHRRRFLQLLSLSSLSAIAGCGFTRIDPWHVLVRSDEIMSLLQEQEILKMAKLSYTADGRVRVLFVKGSPYERGYQQGKLLQKEIQDNIGFLYKQALVKFHFEELFAEVYERMRPFIPEEYVEEMHGLAHGSRMPLSAIHHVHILPELGEWGGKKRVGKIIKAMMAGDDLTTMCSNFSMGPATCDGGEFYVVRVLDWGLHRISKLHQYPLITVNVPDNGIPSANIGWVGFLGAVSGMNAEGITLGEMGYGNPPNETLHGKPMPFMLRDVLSYAKNLPDVRRIISTSLGTNSFIYLMSDGKTKEAELYVRDRERFIIFKPGQEAHDNKEHLPPIPGVSYGGHFNSKMTELLIKYHGDYSLDLLQKTIIPQIVMKSNFQNVIYSPSNLQFYVNNALNKDVYAANQPYTFFDLKQGLEDFTRTN